MLIRFRAWDKIGKRFIENDTDFDNKKGRDLGEYALRPNGKLVFFEATEGGMDTGVKEDMEISFFTGLLDKNGKEIYEGDVVFHGHYKETAKVFWAEKSCAFKIQYQDGVVGDLFAIDDQHLSVLGNIYENPELIK